MTKKRKKRKKIKRTHKKNVEIFFFLIQVNAKIFLSLIVYYLLITLLYFLPPRRLGAPLAIPPVC